MARILCVALLAAVLIAGCGGGGSDDTGKIKQTIAREFAAIADGDAATACGLDTPSGQATLTQGEPGVTCAQVVALLARQFSPAMKTALRNLTIRKITITGNTASIADADLTSTHGSLGALDKPGSGPTLLMKQHDSSWKISG